MRKGLKRAQRDLKSLSPRWGGDVVEPPGVRQSIQIPINHYIIMEDANSSSHPVQHIRGPNKIYLEPFQNILLNTDPAHRDKMSVEMKMILPSPVERKK